MTEPVASRRGLLGAVGAAVGGTIAGCVAPVGSDAQPGSDDGTGPQRSPTPGQDAGSPAANVPSAVTDVYRQTVGSVVLIRSFSRTGTGQGSGFVFRDSRYLLTNEHVIRGAETLEIRYSRGDWRTAEIVGRDYYSDLAVLEVDDPPEYADPLPLVQQDPPIGSQIVAIGNPFGLQETISSGIVSGVNRSMEVNFNRPGGFSIPDAVQTDAALNPGNSGGPMLTLGGKVVGVVRAGRGDNVGFGISAALARRVGTALIEDGTYEHSYMGVALSTVSPTIAEANDLETVSGVIVTSVLEDGPSAGVLEDSREGEQNGIPVPVGGDVIIEIDDERIETLADLSTYLALETSPDDTISIRVLRDGSPRTVDLTLGTRPPPPV